MARANGELAVHDEGFVSGMESTNECAQVGAFGKVRRDKGIVCCRMCGATSKLRTRRMCHRCYRVRERQLAARRHEQEEAEERQRRVRLAAWLEAQWHAYWQEMGVA